MKKIMHILTMMIFTFFLCRGPIMTDSFIIGSAFIAYMVSLTPKNLYLLIPAIGSMITYIPKGFDPWGYIAATIICAIVFSFTGVNKLKLWQISIVAASIVIISISIYSLTFGKVYKTDPVELTLEGLMTFVIVYAFKNVFPKGHRRRADKNPDSLIFVSLALIHGAGLDFAMWMFIIFITLWALNACNSKTALSVTVVAAVTASLMGSAQWGIMATLMIATSIAGYAKGRGAAITSMIFGIVCWALGHVESGVVLGIDTYGLIIAVLVFALAYWRFGKKKPLRIDIAVSQKAATENEGTNPEKQQENGDSCGWEDIGDNKVALVISDGMGKGSKAASESRLVARTTLGLLKYGVPIEETMVLMNSIMLIKNDNDSYATLDLVTVDKIAGKAIFYKIGAAPSIIKRPDRIEEIELSTVPFGIVENLKVRHVETTVRKGDKIIMMSDGVSDIGLGTVRKALKIPKTESNNHQVQTATKMCERIMEKASEYYQTKEKDDLTVMVARIL